MESIEKLRQENAQLKEILAICLNTSLVKELSEAFKRIKSGNYLTEEEFFMNSPLKTS